MKFSAISHPQFQNAFGKLLGASLAPRTMLTLKRLAKRLEEERKAYEATRKQICEEHASKDDSGNPIIQNDLYDIPIEKLPVVTKRIDELGEADVDLGRRLRLEEIEGASLTTLDLMALDDMIDESAE